MLRCINLLEIPDGGDIIVENERIRMKGRGRARKPADAGQVNRKCAAAWAWSSSRSNLWSHMTVLDNVIEGPVQVLKLSKKEAVARAEALLRKVGIHNKSNSYPSQLSGGQQQRVAIARALAMEPKLLLFDEPTSALDPELVGEVLKVIRALAEEGRTMLIVTHEIAFARQVSSRMVFLHDGRIEEDGSPEKVCCQPVSDRCRAFLSQCLDKI